MIACLAAIALAGGAETSFAQESIADGTVSGRVLDPSGAVVAGARVIARQASTNATWAATTDRDGRFRLSYLKVGVYVFTVQARGFADDNRSLTITPGGAFDLTVTLALEGIDTSVRVSASDTMVETSRSQIASTIPSAEVGAIPLNGRNVLDLALLVPGVAPPNVGGGTQLFAETSAVPGSGLSVASQRNFSNSFLVDGLSANDDAAGLSGLAYGVDAVESFQVVTSGGQAELGRALGGYVSIVTKSGSNNLAGDVYGYARDDRFNAANPLLGRTLPLSQAQFGLTLGGPVVRNRTFYFVNVEGRRLDQSGLTTIRTADAAAINDRLDAVGYPGPHVDTGTYRDPVRTGTALGKIDHRLTDAARLTVRYSEYDVSADRARGAGGLSAPSAATDLDSVDRALAVSSVVVLSPRTVNETRAQVTVSRLDAPPADAVGPAVSIAGVAVFGTSSGAPTVRRNAMYEVVDNVSRQLGHHALRAGADGLYNALHITFPRAVRGSYSFSSLSNFLAGTYTSTGFSQTFGADSVSVANPNLGAFVQDEWKAGAALTVNAGVRYDVQWLKTIATDWNNVAPRLGVAWRPLSTSGTVIRASAGVFYDRIPLRALANALLSAGNGTDPANLRQVVVTLAPAEAAAPAFPAVLTTAAHLTTLVNLTTMDRRIRNASSRQASIEVERQLGPRATVTVGYERLTGRDLIMAINQNVPACAASGTNNACRPNPAFANDNQYSSAGRSQYNALHVSFVERPSGWGTLRVSYTLAKALNDVGEAFFNGPIDPSDLSKDWGRSDDDQRHRLVLDGALDVPRGTTSWRRVIGGLRLSGVVQAYSSLPFNVTSGVNTLQGTAGRPMVNGEFIPRNAGVADRFFTANARISRMFGGAGKRSEVFAEVFNLTNRTNVTAVNGNFGSGTYPTAPSPAFGQPTAVGDPRSWQFGARVSF